MLVVEEQINIVVNEVCVLLFWMWVLCLVDLIDGEVELEWFDLVFNGQLIVVIWVGKQGLVVLMLYQCYVNLIVVCVDLVVCGWLV